MGGCSCTSSRQLMLTQIIRSSRHAGYQRQPARLLNCCSQLKLSKMHMSTAHRRALAANGRSRLLVRPSRSTRYLSTAVRASTDLRLFLDTADTKAIAHWLETGLFYGVTCNPTIIQRDGVKCNIQSLTELSKYVLSFGAEEMHVQAWGETSAQLHSTALALAAISQRVVVKLPCTMEGVKAAKQLAGTGIRINLTGLYASHQVLVAQAIGADYAAPYLGRMNDAYGPGKGTDQIVEMLGAIEGCNSKLRLMVASVREATDMPYLSSKGCNTFTISPATASKLLDNPLTAKAIADFQEAAQSNI